MYLFFGATLGEWPADSLTEMTQSWAPTQERINFEIGMITGNLSQQIQFNSAVATYLESNFFVSLYGFWRVSGLMLIGMALYKLGFFTAKKSNAYYYKPIFILFPLGITLIIVGVIKNFNADWNWEYSRFLGSQFNYWGSLFLCIAYISILMIFVNSNILKSLKNRFAAVGRMALTNYISQSIICTLLFFVGCVIGCREVAPGQGSSRKGLGRPRDMTIQRNSNTFSKIIEQSKHSLKLVPIRPKSKNPDAFCLENPRGIVST